jgi:tyrosyl-tRNA synthetase
MIKSMETLDLLTRGCKEIVTKKELREVLNREERKAYIGYEPSGLAHLGFFITANKARDLLTCGFDVTVLLADWHAQINDKFGGDLEKIRTCGEYLKDVFYSMRVYPDFRYASDMVDDEEYWATLIRGAKHTTLARIKRALTIMGRKSNEANMDFSKTIYPLMQVTDIFMLEVDIALAGMDQRKAHMLAREIAPALGLKKPVAMHLPLIPSLEGSGRMDGVKMSKSRPQSAIFVHDSDESIREKMKRAYCPAGVVEDNPVLAICKTMVFQSFKSITIEREQKYGGDIEIESYEELERLFSDKQIHPLDLKNTTADYLSRILKPCREYFEKHSDNFEAVENIMTDGNEK